MLWYDDYFGRSSTPTNDSSLPIVTSMQRFTHHGLRQAYSIERCIEVTIGSEESFVGVLDHPK